MGSGTSPTPPGRGIAARDGRRVKPSLTTDGYRGQPEMTMDRAREYSLKLASERRLDDRLPVCIDAEGFEMGGLRQQVRIADLSRQGTMFEAEQPWKVGVRLWLFFPSGLAVNAKVVWAHGHRHGCHFLRRLSDDEFRLGQSPR
jgi:hypothetical protein